ncbi:MAG TPA: hypothetical protein PLM93_02195 [Sulfuricurvum sp.]|nr:MAG: hypothetical protein B7Y30_07325 [Campylobacterales bacterium 16-40-21]OZA03981.1 MAG: hypothetical protein B7X89_00050 [Sulfuricurvum sp. 17-40-25]HQS65981.1 hypothetical protein [Sulfuricurvum sp.]HQT35778.1 hypothetical protein [Sulfuricurvum sp.]
MITDIALLILAGGLPYYTLLEKNTRLSSKNIFLLSAFLLLCAVVLSLSIPNEHPVSLIVVSLLSAIFSIYKATKTTNFYKLGYYLIFVNAPFFILFEDRGILYSVSLLVSLSGLYLIAKFYEKNYGSANYSNITGITLVAPHLGTYLSFYLIALALYPPFPNSLFFLNYIFKSDPDLLSYIVVTTLFFGNFFLAMRVMRKTLFGRPNPNIHYVRMSLKDKVIHLFILILLLILSIFGLKEILL